MRSPNTTLRTKVLVLVSGMIALYAFAAWVTIRDGANLLGVQALASRVSTPSEPLLGRLQEERRLSTVYLADPDSSLADLQTKRRETDAAAGGFRDLARSWLASAAASSETEAQIEDVVTNLDKLAAFRSQIDDRRLSRADATTVYTDTIESLFRMYDSLGQLDDQGIADTVGRLIDYNKAWELMSQEDALLAGVLVAGTMTSAEHTEFVQLVGTHRFMAAAAVARLPDADQARYDRLIETPSARQLREVEDRLIVGGSQAAKRISADQWQAVSSRAQAELRSAVLAGGDDVVARATPVAAWVVVRLVLATGLGLVLVVMALRAARRLVGQMEHLRDSSRRLADALPGVVERLGRGESVDLAVDVPPMRQGGDEIGQVGHAFNDFRKTAIQTAAEQAALRRSVRDTFLSLARRTQSLVHRQLGILDEAQRHEDDGEKLARLFRADHVATQMRRNSENLIVLSGSPPPRSWRRPVPMIDVIRGAVQEVEDYTRVTISPMGDATLAGRAVVDIMHLLAELIDNALTFSPPSNPVNIRGLLVSRGYAIEVEDRGLGMAGEDQAAANELIASHPEFQLGGQLKLGLFVVSRLASRHDVRVTLKESAYGGTTAVVLIPPDLVSATPPSAPARRSATGAGPGPVLAGVATRPDPAPRPLASGAAPLATRRRPGSPAPEPATAPAGPAGQAAEPAAAGSAQPPVARADGLPQRVRRPRSAQVEAEASTEVPHIDPEEVMRRMSKYQDGTRRGRAETHNRQEVDE